MPDPIFVTTPTGNIGSQLVADLLARGETVHVLARNPDKLPQAVRDAVTVHVGDQFDAATLTKATKGASALFWLTPTSFDAADVRAVYAKAAHTVAAAVTVNQIPLVVNLSSAGAQADGLGPISLLRQVEDALNTTDAAVVHLRPGWFFENFAGQRDAIYNAGAIFEPIPAETALPMVATKDIAVVAAEILTARTATGKIYRGVHGPADISFGDAAKEIEAGIGRPVNYVKITLDDTHKQFLQMGMSADFARLYIEMLGAMAMHGQVTAEPRTDQTTTPTTLQEWAAHNLR